ncbi:Lrp/AsnC family transcriptional regulator [Bordetella bronchialis]|uniref:AsnC family transcriptional regulator n=1 Tax=Bordetella bronchialis TaxID=463025 RepID=A0A193FWB4_9BORD|nr:Lrp/AsnC family transcriptional regulator [Bordetella bronchialis]ANN71476.1 AsnC family transcriptional regulator [Bordetella bronchialis]
MQESLDDLDLRLIALLRDNGRLSTATLAKKLSVSRGTIHNRIERLLRGGTILGFTVRLRSEAEDQGIRAMTLIEVRGNETDAVLSALRRLPEVVQVHSTSGRWDLVAEVRVQDLPTFDRVLRDLRRIKGITNSETNLLLAVYK